MPFLSLEFALFFLLFFMLYWALQPSPLWQNRLLLLASLAWLLWLNWWFVFVLIFYSLLIHLIAQNMVFSTNEKQRRFWLCAGIICAVLILLGFKYADFLRALIYQISAHSVLEILLPLGLSYYVFQSIAYLVAAYQSRIPVLNFSELCLHFAFFPTITAGPIFRAARFRSIAGVQIGAAVQLFQLRQLRFPALAICLILLGTGKSWVLASWIDDYWVRPVFDNPQQYSIAALFMAVYAYTISLFFNFSGYSDLAIGLALLLGFHLPKNFAAPFYALNIRDFWNRWHISLSTWIRDYIYIPLGGSRQGFWRTQIHLFIAFTLSGLWHGNGWHFLLWGMLHGLALIILNIKEKLLGKGKRRYYWQRFIGIFLTFNFVSFAFVLFAVDDLNEAYAFFTAFLHNQNHSTSIQYLSLLLPYLMIFLYPLWVFILQKMIALFNALPLILWFIPIMFILQMMIYFAPEGIPGFLYANF